MFIQNASRKLVLTFMVISTVGWLPAGRAQDQVACATRAEALAKQAFSLLQPGAGTGAERPDGIGRAYRFFGEKCVEENRCGPMELQLSLFEASLDETMVSLQRLKLERFKAVAGVRTSPGEACTAAQKLEVLTSELKAVNERQLSRLDQLAPRLFAEPVGFFQ